MAGAGSIGKKRMATKFSSTSFRKEPDFSTNKPLNDNRDIEGLKEIVSIVGGVVKTFKGRNNDNARAEKLDAQKITATKENTKVMERLSTHLFKLGIDTKNKSKQLIEKSKEGTKKLYNNRKMVVEFPKEAYKKVSGLMKDAMGTKVVAMMRKSIGLIAKPITSIPKILKGGFKMIDSVLTKFLGPMFADMAKTIAKISLAYFVFEGIRQSIWHLVKKYDEGREAFKNAFGEDYKVYADFASSIKDFNKEMKKDGFVSAVSKTAMPVIKSLMQIVGRELSNGFDHVIVAINNWWHKNDPSKQITVEEYRAKNMVSTIRNGGTAPMGREEEYVKIKNRMGLMDGVKDTLADAVIQYGERLFDAQGNVNNQELDMFISKGMHYKDKEFAKLKAKESGMSLEDYLTELFESQRFKDVKDTLETVLGADGTSSSLFPDVRQAMLHGRDSETNFTSGQRDASLRKQDQLLYIGENDLTIAIDKMVNKSDDIVNEVKGLVESKNIRQLNERGGISDIDFESGYLEMVYKEALASGDTEAEHEAYILKSKAEERYGKGALDRGMIYDGKTMMDKEELGNAQEVISQQKEQLEANTRSIDGLTQQLAEMMGGIGGGIMMQNVKNNTTVVNPRTKIEVIERGVNLK